MQHMREAPWLYIAFLGPSRIGFEWAGDSIPQTTPIALYTHKMRHTSAQRLNAAIGAFRQRIGNKYHPL